MDINNLYLKLGVFYRYMLALLIFSMALFVRFMVFPVEYGLPYITFYPAIIICFYLCGIGPGVLITVASSVTGMYIFIPPFWSFGYTPGEMLATATFMLSAFLIGLIIRRMQSYAEKFNAALTALNESKQHFKTLLEDQTEVICRFKQDGTIHYVNDAFCQFFGKNREALIGEKWQPIAYEIVIGLINERLESLAPDCPIITIENRVWTVNGELRWVQFVNRGFFDAEGCLLEIQAIGRDITEKKAHEWQLMHLMFALNHIKEAVYLIDENGHFLYVNEEVTRSLGYTQEELLTGLLISDVDFRCNNDKWAEHWQDLKKQGEVTLETTYHTKNAGEILVEVNANFFQYDGKDYKFALVRDITERKRLEKEREQYYSFFQLSTDSMCIADPFGCFKVVNPTFVKLTGYEESELLAKPFLEFVIPEDREKTLAEMQQQVADRPTLQFENRYLCKDGRIVCLSWSAYYDYRDGVTYATAHDITASRQAEEALLKSEQLFRTMAETVPQIIWITLPDGANVYFNQQWCEYTGLTLAESCGSGWIIPFHPDDRQRAWEAWKRATETDGDYSIECRMRRVDGVYRWWLIRGKSVHDEDGNIIHWFGTCTDIENIKCTEKTLQVLEKRFNLALEFSELGVWDLDLVHDESWRTLRHDQIFGYDTFQTKWGIAESTKHVIAEDRDIFHQCFENAYRTGKLALECRVEHKDKSVHWINAQGCVIYDEKAKPVQMLGTVSDITARKVAEQDIALAATIFDAQEGMFITDSNRLILRVNRAFTRITGYTQDEVVGKNPRMLASGRYNRGFYQGMWESLKCNDVWESEIWNRRKNGEEYPEYLIITVVKDSNGMITNYVATFNDITHIKTTEKNLQDAYDQLQESLNVQIQQEKLASLGVLVGGLAHEINNPMMGIVNYIEFVYEKTEDARSQEILGKALKETNRVIRLVRSMLMFISHPVDASVSDIATALNHVSALVEGDLKKVDTQLHINVSQELPQVIICCNALEQVLLNLLLNAMYCLKKHAQPREITVTVTQSSSSTVEILVYDNGTGVRNEIRQKIFDPFFTTKPPGEGSGLGLAISRQIAESAKGKLELIDSAEGACFKLTLVIAK